MDTRKIVLHGDLAKCLPNGEFECVWHNAREAASAIEVNYPGFFKAISDGYIIVAPDGDKTRSLGSDQLASWNINCKELHIFPVLEGSGGGGGGEGGGASRGIKAILGLALIAVAIVGTGGLAAIGGGSLSTAVFGNAFGITGLQVLGLGASLVMQVFAPAPTSPDQADRVQNTIFTGPLNTSTEGSPLPYVAGRDVLVGGVIFNTELIVEN